MFQLHKLNIEQKAPPQAYVRTPTLHTAATILREGGILLDKLQLSLLALMVMNSAHLGNSLTMIIEDEDGDAMNFMASIVKMVPQNRILEFSHLTPEIIFHKEQSLKRRCIVGCNSKSLSKMTNYLNPLLGRGLAVMQQTYKTKYGSGIEQLHAEGPVSCILSVNNFKDCPLSHPYMLKVGSNNVHAGQDVYLPCLADTHINYEDDYFDVDAARVRFDLERLNERLVEIPFADQIAKNLSEQSVKGPTLLPETIFRMIKIFTIMNNLQAPTENEILARAFNVDVNKMKKYRLLKANMPECKLITDGTPSYSAMRRSNLVATKADYHSFWVLTYGLINVGNGQLSDRQLRVFKAIQKINVDCTVNMTFSDAKTNSDLLIAISNNQGSWAKRETILKVANSDGLEDLSLAELEGDLKYLLDHGCIEKHRVESKRGFLYHVMTMEACSAVKLPHPSAIIDPIYNGEPVQIANILTGQMEII